MFIFHTLYHESCPLSALAIPCAVILCNELPRVENIQRFAESLEQENQRLKSGSACLKEEVDALKRDGHRDLSAKFDISFACASGLLASGGAMV